MYLNYDRQVWSLTCFSSSLLDAPLLSPLLCGVTLGRAGTSYPLVMQVTTGEAAAAAGIVGMIMGKVTSV